MSLNNPAHLSWPTSSVVARNLVAVPVDISQAQILVGANAFRKGLTLWNNSNGSVLVELGAAPTATSFSFRLAPEGYYELPYGFTGQLQGLWLEAGGSGVLVREIT